MPDEKPEKFPSFDEVLALVELSDLRQKLPEELHLPLGELAQELRKRNLHQDLTSRLPM